MVKTRRLTCLTTQGYKSLRQRTGDIELAGHSSKMRCPLVGRAEVGLEFGGFPSAAVTVQLLVSGCQWRSREGLNTDFVVLRADMIPAARAGGPGFRYSPLTNLLDRQLRHG